MGPADLVKPPAGRQHADHAGVGRVDVAQEQQRTRRLVGREHAEVRERPDRIVEDGQVGMLGRHLPRLGAGGLVAADRLVGADHLVAVPLQLLRDRVLRRAAERHQVASDVVPAVRHGEQGHTSHRAPPR